MEQGFCFVKDAASGIDVAINARQVRYVTPTGNPRICAIHFGNNDVVVVTGELEPIVAQLRQAIT
jgi:hypothetical protein